MCHIKKNGTTQELCVSQNQYDKHIAHGDSPGSCTFSQKILGIDDFDEYTLDLKAWSNPSNTSFNIKLMSINSLDKVDVKVFDVTNKLVHHNLFEPHEEYRFGEKLEGGVYFVKITQAGQQELLRLVKF